MNNHTPNSHSFFYESTSSHHKRGPTKEKKKIRGKKKKEKRKKKRKEKKRKEKKRKEKKRKEKKRKEKKRKEKKRKEKKRKEKKRKEKKRKEKKRKEKKRKEKKRKEKKRKEKKRKEKKRKEKKRKEKKKKEKKRKEKKRKGRGRKIQTWSSLNQRRSRYLRNWCLSSSIPVKIAGELFFLDKRRFFKALWTCCFETTNPTSAETLTANEDGPPKNSLANADTHFSILAILERRRLTTGFSQVTLPIPNQKQNNKNKNLSPKLRKTKNPLTGYLESLSWVPPLAPPQD